MRRLWPFLRYVIARYEYDQREQSYRFYVTDALRMIAQGGVYPSQRWVEIIQPQPEIDAEKVIKDTIEKAGLVVT